MIEWEDIVKVNEVINSTLIGIFVIVLVILKLLNKINWSWWWVFAPIWIPLSVVVLFFAITLLVLKIKGY